MANSGSAIIIGASGGIGAAFAHILEKSDAYSAVYRLSRDRNHDHYIDIADAHSVQAAAQFIAKTAQPPTLIICATGLLHDAQRQPEKSIRDLDADWLAKVYKINAIGPALVAKHFLPLMPKKERAIFAALGARVGSISDNRLGGWYGYRAAKAGLHMMLRNIAIEWTRKNPLSIAISLHPGTVDTGLSAPFKRSVPSEKLFTAEYSAQKMLNVIENLRPENSGSIFAWDGQEIVP